MAPLLFEASTTPLRVATAAITPSTIQIGLAMAVPPPRVRSSFLRSSSPQRQDDTATSQ